MNFIEKKKENNYYYFTDELGELEVISPKKLDVDTLDGILMRMFKQKRDEKLVMEIEGLGDVRVSYKYPQVWEELKKEAAPKKSTKQKIKEWLISKIKKI